MSVALDIAILASATVTTAFAVIMQIMHPKNPVDMKDLGKFISRTQGCALVGGITIGLWGAKVLVPKSNK